MPPIWAETPWLALAMTQPKSCRESPKFLPMARPSWSSPSVRHDAHAVVENPRLYVGDFRRILDCAGPLACRPALLLRVAAALADPVVCLAAFAKKRDSGAALGCTRAGLDGSWPFLGPPGGERR